MSHTGYYSLSTSLLLFLIVIVSPQYIQPIYSEWAHEHLVWINAKQQNQSKIMQLVENYQKYQIKVGGVNIDSMWSTCINNFQWDLTKFPNPQLLISQLHSRNIKIIVWATSIINKQCSVYQQGVKNGYFLNNGRPIAWWHGNGAFIDYFNPKAVQWWHKLLDKVIDMGIDGFKCDGTDPLAIQLRPWPYSNYLKRYITIRQYSNRYYGDYYNYTKSKNNNGLIMARPTDSYQINGVLFFRNFAPKYVMFSGWVGDEDSTFHGMRNAMLNIIHSAWNGYLSFGFDIGGYRNKAQNPSVFIRWAQLGAFMPFMQNGGGGIHQPWLYNEVLTKIYKKFVDIHYELKPTFLTYGAIAYSNGVSMLQPLAKRQSYIIGITDPSTFGYILCQKLLVFPIFSESGIAELKFPKGNDWVYFFDKSKVFKQGIQQNLLFLQNQSPVFMKMNSLIAFESALYVVGVEEGQYKQSFMYSNHTDYIEIKFLNSQFMAKITRYYNNNLKNNYRSQKIYFKFIQYDVRPLDKDQSLNFQQDHFVVQFQTNGFWQTINGLTLKSKQNLVIDQQ